jgi:CheY-like chemotaxis protein
MPQRTERQQAREGSDPPRVLIAEDELLVAWHLESLVRDQKLEVCGLVPDGQGAVEQADDLHADLVLMDIRLAGRMDGIEAARQIRANRGTPVIFITAYGDPTTRAHIERVVPGAPVLAKPITGKSLREAIAAVMPPPQA